MWTEGEESARGEGDGCEDPYDLRIFSSENSFEGGFKGWLDLHYCSSVFNSEATPSFALLDIQGPVIVTYVYQLVDGEVSFSFTIYFLLNLTIKLLLCYKIPD